MIKIKLPPLNKNGLLIIGVIILLIAYIFLQGESDKTEINNYLSPKIPENLNSNTVNKINFLISNLEIPKQINVFAVEYEWDEEKQKELANNLGFEAEPIKGGNLISYQNKENGTYLEIDNKNLKIKYYKDLLNNEVKLNKSGLRRESIINIFEQLINSSLIKSKDISVYIDNVSFEEIINPRFVETNEENGTIVKIEAGYKYGQNKIFSQDGLPIVARLAKDGSIIKLEMSLPISNVVSRNSLESISFEEIKNMESSNFRLINIKGGAEYDKGSIDESKISEVNITNGYLGYLLESKEKQLIPFVFLEGNSRLESGPAKIFLAIPANK